MKSTNCFLLRPTNTRNNYEYLTEDKPYKSKHSSQLVFGRTPQDKLARDAKTLGPKLLRIGEKSS